MTNVRATRTAVAGADQLTAAHHTPAAGTRARVKAEPTTALPYPASWLTADRGARHAHNARWLEAVSIGVEVVGVLEASGHIVRQAVLVEHPRLLPPLRLT